MREMESSSALWTVSDVLPLGGADDNPDPFCDAPQLGQKEVRPTIGAPQLMQKRVAFDPPDGVAPDDGGIDPAAGGRRRPRSSRRTISRITTSAPTAMAIIAHKGNPPPSVVAGGVALWSA